MTLSIFAQTLVTGLNLSCFYLLMSLGLVIMFSICGIVNLAHGVLYMLGAYGVFFLTTSAGLDFTLSAVLAVLALGLFGLLFERVIFRTVKGEFATIIVITIGFMIALEAIGYLVFGSQAKGLASPIPGFIEVLGSKISFYKIAVFPLTALIIGGVYAILYRTKLGLAMRASEEDKIAAQLQGVNPNRVNALVFFIGFALAAAAGILISPVYSLDPSMGTLPLTKAFMVIILGGMGSLRGLIAGSIVIGLIDAFLGVIIGPQIAYIAGWAIVIGILIFRPWGLFGAR